MIAENTLTGLGLFSLEVIHLISLGESESIQEIERHIEKNDLIEFLNQKYDQFFFVKFDNSTYDNKALNKYFSNYSGYIEGNEGRKYGIMNDKDGLLLILALICDKVEVACRSWVPDN